MREDLQKSLAAAQAENDALKKLLELRKENELMRVRVGVPGSEGEMLLRIITLVCSEFGVDEYHLRCRTRTEAIAFPRQVAFWLLRELTPMSSGSIAEHFERDHGTVLHGANSVRNRLGDSRFRGRLEQLKVKARQILANGN